MFNENENNWEYIVVMKLVLDEENDPGQWNWHDLIDLGACEKVEVWVAEGKSDIG